MVTKTLKDYLSDFVREDKQKKVAEYFGNKYERWFVYGKLPLTKEEVKKFPEEMGERGVKAIYFGDIFKDMRRLKHYRLDAARGYMNLFETFRFMTYSMIPKSLKYAGCPMRCRRNRLPL